jgi:N-acetylglucosaminyl-diphospho-decaprenol L-rhamnosyltransferase
MTEARPTSGYPEGDEQSDACHKPGIDVVIVSWNTSDQAIQAANAFASSSDVDAHVYVVDNDSLPHERQRLVDRSGDDFELITSSTNLGFGGAANLGLSHGTSPYVAVSNPDVVPAPDALSKLVEVARSEPAVGMVGPVFAGSGNTYHDHLPGPFTLLFRAAIGGFGRRAVPIPDPGEVVEVEQPSGACFVMNRETWEAAGGFDDGYFLWYEDVDLARRLLDAGRVSLLVGGAFVSHSGASSLHHMDDPNQQVIRLLSLRRYIRIHHPRTSKISDPILRVIARVRTRGARDRS